MVLPISAVIPTLNRRERLQRTVDSLLAQDMQPVEIIIIDASPELVAVIVPAGNAVRIRHLPADVRGAAPQRNQGVALATEPFVFFLDDDVDLQPGCMARLWAALQADPRMGAAGAVLSNQHYHPPGRIMRRLLHFLGCPLEGSLAAQFCGPALNFLPSSAGSADPAEWLNLCCTLCRREALPSPPLLPFFTGYSLLEDAALTAQIARGWRIVALPGAVAYHDYRNADYKSRSLRREAMEVTNRWFVMTRILRRRHVGWQLRFAAYQLLMLLVSLRSRVGWRCLPAALAGTLAGAWKIAVHSREWNGYGD